MTQRIHEARHNRPVLLDVDLTAGQIVVHAGTSFTRIEVRTTDQSGPSSQAVDQAVIDDSGQVITVRVPAVDGAGGGGTTVVQSFGNVTGTVTGVTMVNGRIVSGGGTVIQGSSSIVVEAWVPAGSGVKAKTLSADVRTDGPLSAVQAKTMSGDVVVADAGRLDAETMSGDIRVDALTGEGHTKSMSGDIDVHAVQPLTLAASTMSGDIGVTGARVDLRGRSMSGRVRNGSR